MPDYVDILEETEAQIKEVKERDPEADVTGIIKNALEKTQVTREKKSLYVLLDSEYILLGKFAEAEAVINKRIELDPNDPQGWAHLASHFHYVVRDLSKALSTIETATQKALALKDGNLVRASYGERARIAIELKKYKIVEESLERLIQYPPKPGNLWDFAKLEDDFLLDIPEGVIDADILEKYKELCEKGREVP